jgi:hypothetical protein
MFIVTEIIKFTFRYIGFVKMNLFFWLKGWWCVRLCFHFWLFVRYFVLLCHKAILRSNFDLISREFLKDKGWFYQFHLLFKIDGLHRLLWFSENRSLKAQLQWLKYSKYLVILLDFTINSKTNDFSYLLRS